jgi:hypothetical protein
MDLKKSPKQIKPARRRIMVSIFVFTEGVAKYMPFVGEFGRMQGDSIPARVLTMRVSFQYHLKM